jgi:hypothetical protein
MTNTLCGIIKWASPKNASVQTARKNTKSTLANIKLQCMEVQPNANVVDIALGSVQKMFN